MPYTNKPIKTKHARKLADNYWKKHEGKLMEDETLSVWFSKEILLEALADSEICGLRFYMGAYEKDYDHYPTDEHYKGKNTLIIVQTRKKETKDGLIYEDILQDERAKPEYDTVEKLTEYNDGQLCPPPRGRCRDLGLLNY